MTIFLILAPYGAFATLMLLLSSTASLLTAAGVSLATIAIDAVRGRSLKILPVSSAIVFVGIAAYLNLIDPSMSGKAVKLAVDVGVFAVSLGSMLLRYPFTTQYALESVPAEIAAMPGFQRANYIITGVWTASMLLMMLVNAAILYVPGLPIWLGLAVAFAARNSAVFFTKWYSAQRRTRDLAPPANALPKAQ
ncbi:MAG TPA: hypothetical protein VKR55_22790 [Bradyrhizobium sp.]|uniref:hypothetical protein n=1 Tax=Bradyrhizobium sp. TaxID=376 RepID=UPI002CB30E53|nr:hypothetical protein [Bradyrhizobium sp.]HLZ04965.1 hypothetical protein [Bradyrhizobium sp.]